MHKTINNLISIVLPTYNRKYILGKAIESVINQTYENWELIVVDDGSTDNTEILMTGYTDSRIRYIREKFNKGANFCRNLGVKNAKGKYIAFLDSDNWWEPDKLERQFAELHASDKSVAFVFCRDVVRDKSRKFLSPSGRFTESEIGKILYERNIVDTNTVLIKKECFDKAGGFDEQMPRMQDWDLFFRVVNVFGYKAIYIPDCLNNNTIQENSISRDGEKMTAAVFRFLSKYYDYYNNKSLIQKYFHMAFYSMNADAECIYKNIYKNFSNDQYRMLEIFQILLEQLHYQKQATDLLYEWKLKNAKNKSSIFCNILNREDMTIAIYGLGRWAELLYQEIQNLPVKIKYGIDKWKDSFHFLPIKRLTDELEEVDLLVVTIFDEYEEIETELRRRYTGKIVSIESLIQNA